MGTRKNRKNRNRKTKRKLIKGDPVTFLKSLKTPEQIRKHSLFKKRTVKRNMRGGGQLDKPTRKKNIKDLIQKINDEYKSETKWTLNNIEEEYKKANIEPNFLKERFINTYEQKTANDESISDRLSICSKWNNDRIKNHKGISGPYLDGKDIKEGNLSAKEALACAYWSYHTTKDSENNNPRRLSLNTNRQTDTAEGIYFPPSFLRAAGYQYEGFNINKKNETLEAFKKKSEEEKKIAAELAKKAKQDKAKAAEIAADCEEYNGKKYCIGHLIKGIDVTERITRAHKGGPKAIIPAPSDVVQKFGLILGHLNWREPDLDKNEKWSDNTVSNFPKLFPYNKKNYNKIEKFLNTNSASNRNLYICLFLKEKKVDGNIVLDVGILASASRATDKAEENKNINDWNKMMKTYIEKNVKKKVIDILKNKNNEDYVKTVLKNGFKEKLLDLIKGKIDESFKKPVSLGGNNRGTSIWKEYMQDTFDNGTSKFNNYLNDDIYNISNVYILLQK